MEAAEPQIHIVRGGFQPAPPAYPCRSVEM